MALRGVKNTRRNKMKLFTTIVAGLTLIASTAYAKDNTIQDHYKTVTNKVPYQQCFEVDVPIYGKVGGGASAGDVLGGMIIGGLIGKGATGKDNGAAAGAVIGGMIAADKNQGQQGIVGYRQETRCETKYNYSTEEVYSHSTITFWDNGKKYVLRFNR